MNDDALDSHDAMPGLPTPPQNTALYGHAEQIEFLCRSWASGRMHHALLFDGPSGIGKSTLAFKFARHVISNPVPERAPEQFGDENEQLVHQIAMGAHPQVLHLTRPFEAKTSKFKTQLTIDETRKIGHFLSMTIPGHGWRVVIVDPVNDMNSNAANALLKNLEEPTPRTLFMLIAQSAGRLLPTIRSRCLHLRFSPLDDMAMRGAMETLHIGQGTDSAAIIAHAGGSPRMAAMLAEGGALEIIAVADRILSGGRFDAPAALKLGEALATRDAEPLFILLVEHLAQRIHEAAVQSATAGRHKSAQLTDYFSAFSERLAIVRGFNLDKRQYLLETLHEMHARLSA